MKYSRWKFIHYYHSTEMILTESQSLGNTTQEPKNILKEAYSHTTTISYYYNENILTEGQSNITLANEMILIVATLM